MFVVMLPARSCPVLRLPTNVAAISCSDGNNAASTCIYECSGGFTAVGNPSLTCRHDGTWDKVSPACIGKWNIYVVTDMSMYCDNNFVLLKNTLCKY